MISPHVIQYHINFANTLCHNHLDSQFKYTIEIINFYLFIKICYYINIYTFMHETMFLLFCFVIFMSAGTLSKSIEKQTIVTYVVPDEPKKKNQLIKFSMQVSEQDASLFQAIQQAKQLESNLKSTYRAFCNEYQPEDRRENCEDYVQSSDYSIKAEYYHLRGVQTFKAFIVEFEIQFTTAAVEKIGQIIDQLSDQMSGKQMVLGQIIWDDFTEDSSLEELMDEGMMRAKSTCNNLGMKLHRIKSVQVYTGEHNEQEKKPKPLKKEQQSEEQQEEQEEQEDQQEEQQEEIQRYKFVVVCKNKSIKKSTAKKLINMAKKAGGVKTYKSAKVLLE